MSSGDRERGQKFTQQMVTFVIEQDGPTEQMLKTRLCDKFKNDFELVTKAFLVQVCYDNPLAFDVALCVVHDGKGSEQLIVDSAGETFASIFGSHEHLDIIFLSEVEERQIEGVAKPFYRRGRT